MTRRPSGRNAPEEPFCRRAGCRYLSAGRAGDPAAVGQEELLGSGPLLVVKEVVEVLVRGAAQRPRRGTHGRPGPLGAERE
jgi:hypothetical protein